MLGIRSFCVLEARTQIGLNMIWQNFKRTLTVGANVKIDY